MSVFSVKPFAYLQLKKKEHILFVEKLESLLAPARLPLISKQSVHLDHSVYVGTDTHKNRINSSLLSFCCGPSFKNEFFLSSNVDQL